MKFFAFKNHENLSDNTYDRLRTLLTEMGLPVHSLKTSRTSIQTQLDLRVRNYDCCIKGCMAFTGEHKKRRKCEYCEELRFVEPDGVVEDDPLFYPDFESYATLKARAAFTYIPIIPRLKLLYANQTWSEKMRYPLTFNSEKPASANEEESESNEEKWERVRDLWEGEKMKKLKAEGIHEPLLS